MTDAFKSSITDPFKWPLNEVASDPEDVKFTILADEFQAAYETEVERDNALSIIMTLMEKYDIKIEDLDGNYGIV